MSNSKQDRVEVIPLTQPKANAFVQKHHRHHGPIPGGFAWFCVGAIIQGDLVGVAIAGRPTNRNNDDGQTVEVLRVASDGSPNVCSALYGACTRASRALGARRVITYTLEEESGISLRASGWTRDGDGIESWWTHAGSRTPAVSRDHMTRPKVRWVNVFRDQIEVNDPSLRGAREGSKPADKDDPQTVLIA